MLVIKKKERLDQWNELWSRKGLWGDNWILGGDLNDIRNPQEKKGGRTWSEASCQGFRDFIRRMDMEEIQYQGSQWTWANNWTNEGLKLDWIGFLGALSG